MTVYLLAWQGVACAMQAPQRPKLKMLAAAKLAHHVLHERGCASVRSPPSISEDEPSSSVEESTLVTRRGAGVCELLLAEAGWEVGLSEGVDATGSGPGPSLQSRPREISGWPFCKGRAQRMMVVRAAAAAGTHQASPWLPYCQHN